jgi:hypothetical protein
MCGKYLSENPKEINLVEDLVQMGAKDLLKLSEQSM